MAAQDPTAPDASASQSYTADDVEVLSHRVHVRRYPCLYIGEMGRKGLHVLLDFLLDIPLSGFRTGHVRQIDVRLHGDGALTLAFDGPGIVVAEMQPGKMTNLEWLFTHFSGHGSLSCLSVCNAVSERFQVEVRSKGHLFRQEYRRGLPTAPPHLHGPPAESGTTIHFLPDHDIFAGASIGGELLRARLQELAFLCSGLRVSLENEQAGTSEQFCYDDGLGVHLETLTSDSQPLYPDVVRLSGKMGLQYEIAFRHSLEPVLDVRSYANGARTNGGGTHVSGFRLALLRSLRQFARNRKLLPVGGLPREHYFRGLFAVVAVWMDKPSFSGATKDRMVDPTVEGLIAGEAARQLSQYWEQQPAVAGAIVQQARVGWEETQAARLLAPPSRRSPR